MKYKTAANGAPILDQFSEEGFIDCMFRVKERIDHDQHFELHLQAAHKGTDLGLKALVRRDIQGGFDENTNIISEHVYDSAVRLVSTGPESDALVAAIASLYDLPAPQRMVESIAFTGLALHQSGEVDMEREPIKIKLFGFDQPQDPSDRYFESYFNLDLSNGFVYWNEKDQEYRVPLLRGISATYAH